MIHFREITHRHYLSSLRVERAPHRQAVAQQYPPIERARSQQHSTEPSVLAAITVALPPSRPECHTTDWFVCKHSSPWAALAGIGRRRIVAALAVIAGGRGWHEDRNTVSSAHGHEQ